MGDRGRTSRIKIYQNREKESSVSFIFIFQLNMTTAFEENCVTRKGLKTTNNVKICESRCSLRKSKKNTIQSSKKIPNIINQLIKTNYLTGYQIQNMSLMKEKIKASRFVYSSKQIRSDVV